MSDFGAKKTQAKRSERDEVLVVEPGEEITASTPRGPEKFTIAAPCDAKNDGHWYCVTHDHRFDNQIQKDIHIEAGSHRLAWNCRLHGPEVP